MKTKLEEHLDDAVRVLEVWSEYAYGEELEEAERRLQIVLYRLAIRKLGG